MEKPRQKKHTFNKTDLKVIDLLQKTTKALTLQEIANKTGEAPQKIAQSLCKLLAYNEKFLTEMLLQIYL
ncbi:MAG: hypothetical protein M1167_06690 [Chloroflexi bacterium]|nr:hypothetical protein [Chloroflexota bacterium]